MSWMTVLEMDGYLVAPDEEGPAMYAGQKFQYTLPEPKTMEVWADLTEARQREEMEQHAATAGTWYVIEVYWEMEKGSWVQHVVLKRNRPRQGR